MVEACEGQVGAMIDFSAARANMVESQIRTDRVTDRRVLAAFASLPREHFLPGEFGPILDCVRHLLERRSGLGRLVIGGDGLMERVKE